MVMESEMASGQALSLNTDDCSSLDRPDSQMSNKSDRWRPGMDVSHNYHKVVHADSGFCFMRHQGLSNNNVSLILAI